MYLYSYKSMLHYIRSSIFILYTNISNLLLYSVLFIGSVNRRWTRLWYVIIRCELGWYEVACVV